MIFLGTVHHVRPCFIPQFLGLRWTRRNIVRLKTLIFISLNSLTVLFEAADDPTINSEMQKKAFPKSIVLRRIPVFSLVKCCNNPFELYLGTFIPKNINKLTGVFTTRVAVHMTCLSGASIAFIL